MTPLPCATAMLPLDPPPPAAATPLRFSTSNATSSHFPSFLCFLHVVPLFLLLHALFQFSDFNLCSINGFNL